MRKVQEMMAAAGVAMGLAGLVGVAHAAPEETAQHEVWEDVAQASRKGPVDVTLFDQAVLHVPAGEVFVPQPQADRLLNLWGNPGNYPEVSGLLLPRDPRATWYMPVRFTRSGYIKDDDARSWNVDDMLKSLREGTEEQNKEREKLGEPSMDIVNWSEAPRYDAATQRLVWAMTSRVVDARPDAPLLVNYNTYALGRYGYFSMNMVTPLAQLPALKPVAEQQLAALDYNAGKHYAEFDPKTDRVAGYGLVGLVVGAVDHKQSAVAQAVTGVRQYAAWILAALVVLVGAMIALRRRQSKAAPVAGPGVPPASAGFAGTVADPDAAAQASATPHN